MKFRKLVSIFLAVAALSACGGGSLYMNEAYTFPIAVSDESRVVLLPNELTIPDVDADQASAAFGGAVMSECVSEGSATSCLPSEPLKAVVGGLGKQLAAEFGALARNGGGTMSSEVLAAVVAGIDLINGAIPGSSFRYIVAGDVVIKGSGMVPNTSKVEVMGGIFDVQERRPVSAFLFEDTLVNDTALAALANWGKKVFSIASCPRQDDSCSAEQAALGIQGLRVVRF